MFCAYPCEKDLTTRNERREIALLPWESCLLRQSDMFNVLRDAGKSDVDEVTVGWRTGS